jgi:hypothetical protein
MYIYIYTYADITVTSYNDLIRVDLIIMIIIIEYNFGSIVIVNATVVTVLLSV